MNPPHTLKDYLKVNFLSTAIETVVETAPPAEHLQRVHDNDSADAVRCALHLPHISCSRSHRQVSGKVSELCVVVLLTTQLLSLVFKPRSLVIFRTPDLNQKYLHQKCVDIR